MNRLCRILMLTMIVVTAFCSFAWADKITVDPNTPGVQVDGNTIVSKDDIDPRLSQKLIYYSGYKRLHSVVDDIADMTNVQVYCGLNANNWQVRDIPIVVCVKGLSLGKVLQALADTAHLHLSRHKLTTDGKETWSYRLSRSAKDEQEIDSLFDKQREYDLAVCNWTWDAMRAFGKLPGRTDVDKRTRLMAKLIASLGDDSKNKLLAYETFRFSGKDSANKDIVHELYRIAWNKGGALGPEQNATEPIAETDLEKAVLTIKLVDYGTTSGLHIEYNLNPLVWKNADIGSTAGTTWCGMLTDLTNYFRNIKNLDLPPYPQPVTSTRVEDDMSNPEMEIIDEEQWSKPALNEKFDLEKPSDKTPVFADLLEALSKASGFNIICEDFTSHRPDRNQHNVPQQYQKGVTLSQALRRLHWGQYTWFINADDHLLVGWIGMFWRNSHRNLVPEAYLASLQKKLGKEGVDVDDAASFASISNLQFYEWISDSRYLYPLCQGYPTNDVALWKLYSALKEEDKALAKSEAGLPLAKLDPAWIRDAFLAQKKAFGIFMSSLADDEWERKQLEDAQQKEQALTDTDVISTMIMRLVRTPATHMTITSIKDGNTESTYTKAPAELGLSQYKLEIEYEQGGEKRKLTTSELGLIFPVFVPERAAQILKENNKR